MKICAISDTHGQRIDIPECDILLHCGDISPMADHSFVYQKQWFFDDFIPQLKELPAKQIVFCGGNHDFYLWEACRSQDENKIHKALPLNCHYLRDNEVVINGLRIYGTPWIPVLENWAFYLPQEGAAAQYASMSEGLDIVISHGPPHGACDTILEYNLHARLGSMGLFDRVREVKPKYVFCGHIHSGRHEWEPLCFEHPTRVRNVSVLNEEYEKAYEPYVMEI